MNPKHLTTLSRSLTAATFAVLAGAPQASHAARYTIEPIDGGEGKSVSLHAISPNGKMTGDWCCNSKWHHQPFIASGDRFRKLSVQPDETAQGWAINSAGVVMGESYSETNGEKYFYEDDNGRHYIESDVPFVGRDINKSGQIPGYQMALGGSDYGAFIYSTSDGSFSPIPGDIGQVDPSAINDAGTVVGHFNSHTKTGCFVYQNNVLTELDDLGGQYCYMADINNKGVAVGYAGLPDGRSHALMWDNGVMTDLLPDSYKSWANGNNNKGQIVGQIKYEHPVSEKAFLYENKKLTLAKALLDPADAARWTDFLFLGISDNGEIIGRARLDGGSLHAIVMRPVR